MCSHWAGQQPCYLQKKLLPSSILCGKWMFYATSTRFFNASFWYSLGISRSSRLMHLSVETLVSLPESAVVESWLCPAFSAPSQMHSCLLPVPLIVKICFFFSVCLSVVLSFEILLCTNFSFGQRSRSQSFAHGNIRTAKSDVSRGLTLSFVFPSRQ